MFEIDSQLTCESLEIARGDRLETRLRLLSHDGARRYRLSLSGGLFDRQFVSTLFADVFYLRVISRSKEERGWAEGGSFVVEVNYDDEIDNQSQEFDWCDVQEVTD